MNMSPTQPEFNHVVAFEVSKHELVVHMLPADTQERIANTGVAVRRLLKREHRRNVQQQLGPLLVVCEATGGYERAVLAEAAALDLATHRAHGSRTRMYARYHGKQAKTDPIDARLLARYGHTTPDLPLHRPPSPEHETLRALRNRRDELLQMLRMELNRLEHAHDRKIKGSLARHCKLLKAEADALEAEIAALIQATPEFRHKAGLMRSVKGVGPLTVAACLAYLPELGTLSKAEVAALAGLAPHANDSGQHRGARHIGGGRKTVRTSLYMAALVARSCNPRLRAFANTLKARGKPNKLVLTAIMRKLVVILNAVLKSGMPANP
jgi:transposase